MEDLDGIIAVTDERLDQMLAAHNRDLERQGEEKRAARDRIRSYGFEVVPERMDEAFYRGMLSACISFYSMLPGCVSPEHGMVSVEEFYRVVLDRIVLERARRSVEAVA